jgi:APA family basic amino acid/polyamine antiporter
MPDTPRPYKVWGYPIVPGLFVLICVALIVITCINHPREAALGVVLMLTGVPFYWYWKGNAQHSDDDRIQKSGESHDDILDTPT